MGDVVDVAPRRQGWQSSCQQVGMLDLTLPLHQKTNDCTGPQCNTDQALVTAPLKHQDHQINVTSLHQPVPLAVSASWQEWKAGDQNFWILR